MSLTVSKTNALIGIDRVPSRLEIQTQNAQLELHQKHAKINIHAELPRVEIDQYEAFASAGLKNYLDLTKDAADRGYQQAMEYISKVAGDGDTLAAIEKGGNPIADIAERDAYPEHEFNIDFLPKASPKIEIKGDLQIDTERNVEGILNGVEGTYTPGSVNLNYTPVQISVYLKQYASINFSYQGNNVDMHI